MKVSIPQPLLSYTNGVQWVEADGTSLDALLRALDRSYPGIRFRVVDEQDRPRRHIRFFVNREQVDRLDVALAPTDEIHIFQALSGG